MPRPIPRELPEMSACFPDIRRCPRLNELKLRRYRCNLVATRETFRLWNQLAPAIERMRVTRGDGLYENFEYWAAKGRLWAKAHPGGAYPRNMPRMRDLKGVGVGPGTIFRPAIFGDTPE